MGFQLDVAGVCHRGMIKKRNEDNMLFFDKTMPRDHSSFMPIYTHKGTVSMGSFLAVFDGVSGVPYGDLASYTAAHSLQGIKRKGLLERVPHYLDSIIQTMNRFVYQKAKQMYVDKICTTVVGFYFDKSRIWMFNVGDSKALLAKADQLSQISSDDTNQSYLWKQGIQHCKSSLIQYLGIDPSVMRIAPHIVPINIKVGDTLLLCSDGMTAVVSEDVILKIISECGSASDAVDALLQAAFDGGGKDNITVIVCKFLAK